MPITRKNNQMINPSDDNSSKQEKKYFIKI